MTTHGFTTVTVDVIGAIWQPGFDNCATMYRMPVYADDFPLTRELVSDWVDSHAGDFRTIADFRAQHYVSGWFTDWADDESECIYFDCMYPDAGED